MNLKKMFAVIAIWIVVSVGWFMLGVSVWGRAKLGILDGPLARDVSSLWGSPQVQAEPSITVAGSPGNEIPPARSEVGAEIHTENRKRGLLWFPVYKIRFSGAYTVTNKTAEPREYTVKFALPESNAEFQKQEVLVDGQPLPEWRTPVTTPIVPPGKSSTVTFAYESRGTERWKYDLPDNRMVEDVSVTVKINDPGYDFDVENPDSSPPDRRGMTAGEDGMYTLEWTKKQVTNARDVVIEMPRKKQPADLVTRITVFAPVALFFFFAVMVTVQVVRKLSLHPMHYLFLAGAFFAFHLLMAYLADHVPLVPSFWISAATSVFLVVMYLWLVAGPKAAIVYAGLSQLVYLVLFSYSFFLEGFTGLTVTVGAIVTLAVLMVLTARVRWGEAMPELEAKGKRAAPAPAGSGKGDVPGFVGEGNGGATRPPAL